MRLPWACCRAQQPDVLDFSEQELTSLPREVALAEKELSELNIDNNSFVTLPDGILRLEHLQILHASYNKLASVPANIHVLRSLRELKLANNDIEELPDRFGELPLQVLHLDGNSLSFLPATFANMPLTYLDLSENQVQDSAVYCSVAWCIVCTLQI